ncbi:hypothetical protein GOP47_0012796 [Adiantum capillus-veneris]|uniref:Peroxidase n=1 Tax=Adiantum capillus-veneris TaxID=13818 RepID=A0A9D4URC8_ADICA|nr:hypothetical protein GOP47_0012796 [Adiantum capillus-veneris]
MKMSRGGDQLSTDFYFYTCPQLEEIVYRGMHDAVQKEARLAASILRLIFHDCFVQGCDASVLLDDTPSFQGEKTAGPNNNSLRGFEVIDDIKSRVESACPGIVSCADILALTSRDGVSLLNGPKWDVPLGRRDSKTASFNEANTNIPAPNSTLSQLISKFSAQGLSTLDMVVLSGAHTIGKARCVTFRQRLYNQGGNGTQDPILQSSFGEQLLNACPQVGGDNNLSPLDMFSPTVFNSQYYHNLLMGEGLLASDQILASPTSSMTTFLLTHSFANSEAEFFENFKNSMIKLNSINVLTRSQGEIRQNCRKVNT